MVVIRFYKFFTRLTRLVRKTRLLVDCNKVETILVLKFQEKQSLQGNNKVVTRLIVRTKI